MATGLVRPGGSITALLGPTNTGKTHRAVERMLEHASGMIGLPLRLLAREIYDRVSAQVGESAVALVTGEEKRVPRRPRYWICTTEAMPVGRDVEFLAIDEIQLAAHAQRGHVFTDRLLHARGLCETWLLGADTMRPLVEHLVPTATIRSLPRLSTLRMVAPHRLSALPARSALIAFSVPEVYRLADRLRRRRGGAAVVLGALSPRTRNAQVAMFQAGEVDCLVATDAIGMGLNLDIAHVAFAELRKFDGREPRALHAAEIGQIAGRAGRYCADGTFGTIAPLAMDPRLALDIESHRFRPVRRLVWRTHELDFTSIATLLASLREGPRRGCFQRVEHADDFEALLLLAQRDEVRRAADEESRVRLLWEVCQIPDFRKLLPEHHAQLLGEIFLQLTRPRARLDPDWLEERVKRLEATGGSIDELLMRMESVRMWSYVAYRSRWLDDATHWQERTQAVEDALSEALHQRLVERFVERRARRPGGFQARSGRTTRRGEERPPDAPFAASPFSKLLELRSRAAPFGEEDVVPSTTEAWVADLVDAPHARFRVDVAGRIHEADGATHGTGRLLARLVRGTDLLHPEVRLVLEGEPGAGARARLQRRLVAFSRDLVAELVAPLRDLPQQQLTSAARGLAYQLQRGLGSMLLAGAHDQIAALTLLDRRALETCGVVLGRRCAFLPSALTPAAVEVRMALCAAAVGRPLGSEPPRAGARSVCCERGVAPDLYAAIGYPVAGGRAVRADVAERTLARLHALAEQGPFRLPRGSTRWLGCGPREVGAILQAWGFARSGSLWRLREVHVPEAGLEADGR